MPDRSEATLTIVIAAVTAGIVGVVVRALLAPLRLFVVVEWGLAILVGVVLGLVAANVWRASRRSRTGGR